MSSLWYFAYGSNMSSSTLRGRRGIEFAHALPGRLEGWRLELDKPPLFPIGESFATIVADAAATVLGVLYRITDDDMAHIEATEGVPLDNYRRVDVSVEPLPTTVPPRVAAVTLVSNHRDPALRPSQRYMNLLIAGATEHGLPEEYVTFLRGIQACPETPEAVALRERIDAFMRRS